MEELLSRVKGLEIRVELLEETQKQDADEAVGMLTEHESRLEEMEKEFEAVRTMVHVHEVHFEGLVPSESEGGWESARSSGEASLG